MKALKWELVRKLTVSTTSGSGSSPSSRSSATSLATSESSTPRVALNWKLRDSVALRRSSTSTLPSSSASKSAAAKQRPHAQSEPAMPLKQLLTKTEPRTKAKPPGSEVELNDARSNANSEEENAKPARSSKALSSNNNEEKEQAVAETVADTTALQPMTSSASSSETESKSKFPAISRKKSTSGPQLAAQRLENEAKEPSPSGRIDDSGSGSEPESSDNVTRGAPKQGRAASNHSRQKGGEREGKEEQEGSSDSDSRSKHKATKRSEQKGDNAHELSFSDDEEEAEGSS